MGARGGPKQAGSAVEALEVLHMVDDGLLGCARVSGADGGAVGRDKAVLLLGLPGVSKTTMLRALARHLGQEPDR